MGRTFDVPSIYRSTIISSLKLGRRALDQRKIDFSPSILDLGPVRFKVARHFGFCFGVENAIEIAYRALAENPDKRVFLLSEMIHNPHVNADLKQKGVRFLMTPAAEILIPFDELKPEDIVIVPAFGTTVELFDELSRRGVDPKLYNATCPFVEKVWKRALDLGKRGYSIIIHGKDTHEETRATFSHARLSGPSLVIRDEAEANILCEMIRGDRPITQFFEKFPGRASQGFDPERHLQKIGVVNQTTMLATETQHIAKLLRAAIIARFGESRAADHFADTRDTLCYATSENQESVYGLLADGGDLALVVGGYNSSNTSHLAELCYPRVPTYYIKDADEIISGERIRCLDLATHCVKEITGWLPSSDRPIDILLTAGASCPDALVDSVITRVAALFGVDNRIESAIGQEVPAPVSVLERFYNRN